MRFKEYIANLEEASLMRSPLVQGAITQQAVAGGTPYATNDQETALDDLQAMLDVAGIIPSVGIAPDVLNALIYAGRAYQDPDKRKQHAINSVISLVSAMPFGDIAKLLKARQYNKTAKGFVKFGQNIGKPLQVAARRLKDLRGNPQMNQQAISSNPTSS